MWNLAIVGLAVTFAALFAVLTFRPWLEWLNMVLGLWLFVSPWILAFPTSATLRWNAVITGLIVASLSAWVLTQERSKRRQ
jgi:hypothetical protein